MKLVRARQNGGEISHFRRAETTSFHCQNRYAPKPFHEYATIKPEVKREFYVTCLYATAGIRRFRLINVAPTSMGGVRIERIARIKVDHNIGLVPSLPPPSPLGEMPLASTVSLPKY